MKRFSGFGWIFLVFSIAIGFGCREEVNYGRDRVVKKEIDSLFRMEWPVLDSQMSVRCSIQIDENLPRMVDSIVIVRKQEIEALLERERSQN